MSVNKDEVEVSHSKQILPKLPPKAFTLIELFLVISILAILSALLILQLTAVLIRDAVVAIVSSLVITIQLLEKSGRLLFILSQKDHYGDISRRFFYFTRIDFIPSLLSA